MKKFNLLLPVLLISVSLLFVYCSKDGDAGPQGPAGPAGPAGPTGPQGPAGTANVVYSNWLDVTFTRQVPAPGDTSWVATINAPKLVDSILNKGEIKVYVNVSSSATPAVFALPITSDLGFVVIPYYQVGKINLISDLDAGTEVQNGQKTFQYRYVLIPGTVPGRMATINWNNYEEVKKYLGLKD